MLKSVAKDRYTKLTQYVCLWVQFSMIYGHNWRIYKSNRPNRRCLLGATSGIIEKNMGGRLLGHGRFIGIIRYPFLIIFLGPVAFSPNLTQFLGKSAKILGFFLESCTNVQEYSHPYNEYPLYLPVAPLPPIQHFLFRGPKFHPQENCNSRLKANYF